jgi:hypothetical protein
MAAATAAMEAAIAAMQAATAVTVRIAVIQAAIVAQVTEAARPAEGEGGAMLTPLLHPTRVVIVVLNNVTPIIATQRTNFVTTVTRSGTCPGNVRHPALHVGVALHQVTDGVVLPGRKPLGGRQHVNASTPKRPVQQLGISKSMKA